MVYDAARKELVVFGGSQPGGSDWDDTWIWDGTTWTQKFLTTSPPGRQFHAMAYDAARGQVVLFGGGSIIDLFAPKNDTWIWDGTNWIQVFPATSPPGRISHAMTYDTARAQVLLFGGFGSGFLNDTWIRGSLFFPLKGTGPGLDQHLSPYTAPINAVFDHTMKGGTGHYQIYGCDSNAEDFKGEVGNINPSSWGSGCRHGYQNAALSNFLQGYANYLGAGQKNVLFYDGHPGFDYQSAFGNQVYAVENGIIRYPTAANLRAQGVTIGGDPDIYNVLQLDPGTGYVFYYLHLSTHPRTISALVTTDLPGEDFIATKIGTPGTSTPGVLPAKAPLSISGSITLGGQPLPGVQVQLLGTKVGGGCGPASSAKTDMNGNYLFSSLPAGYYHLRAAPQGYSFVPAHPHVIVKDGTQVICWRFNRRIGHCWPVHFRRTYILKCSRKTSKQVLSRTEFFGQGWRGRDSPLFWYRYFSQQTRPAAFSA